MSIKWKLLNSQYLYCDSKRSYILHPTSYIYFIVFILYIKYFNHKHFCISTNECNIKEVAVSAWTVVAHENIGSSKWRGVPKSRHMENLIQNLYCCVSNSTDRHLGKWGSGSQIINMLLSLYHYWQILSIYHFIIISLLTNFWC